MTEKTQHSDVVPGNVVLGIDVGTQSAKCVVLNASGQLRGVGQEGYPVLMPRPNWAEEDPEAWWQSAVTAVRQALQQAQISADDVKGIGLTGQMHGFVPIGHTLTALRPAVIWMDRRSAALCDTIQSRVPPQAVRDIAGNRLSPGFAAATLEWMHEFEPDILSQTRAIVGPKDYLALRLSGEISGDPSDASATWLYDIVQRRWSETLAAACHAPMNILPDLHESAEIVGTLREDAAETLGLRPGIPVVAGAADQAAMLVAVGVVESGRGVITMGTGGQMTIVSDQPLIDPELRLNTFCSAIPNRWYTMGAILNGGIALRWWRNIIDITQMRSYPEMLADAAQVPAGCEGLIFLPYLEGERTPHMDPGATGAFIGLTARHTQAHMIRAVLEGVAYAFRDCLLTLRTVSPIPDHFLIGGGGSKGPLWRQIMASVLGVGVQTIAGSEHTAIGAAVLAGLGSHVFADVAEANARVVRYGPIEDPDPAEQAVYEAGHAEFQALYHALRTRRA